MIQFEYFNYKLKQNSATKIKQTVGAITPPDGYAFGVLSALTNLETVSSTLITGYNAVFIHTLNSQVPTESAVNAFVTDVASGKVDKTNVAYRLYGTDENGNQTTFPIGVNNLRDVQVDGVSVVDTDGIANIDLTGYLQKTGGTLTGDLAFQYNTNNPKLRIIQSGQNTNHLRFINNNYASQSISFDLSQAAIHPLVTGRGHLGTSDIHFGDAHIDKIYTPIINNGYDISVPVTASAQTLALKSEVDLAANSGRMITDQGVWYAKMYAATIAPNAEDGTNYADFSQTDDQGNPIIVIYERQNGAWVQDQTITPPADYDGYVSITSKIWDITEQTGQQGGRILWNHQSKEFTPYPNIVSFEDAALTGTSTAPTPTESSPNDQIANKEYVDNATANGGYHPDLLDYKWADHQLNDVSWLRADTFSWQSGAVYQAAYQHLINDIGGVTSLTITNGTLTFNRDSGLDGPGYYGWTASGVEAYTASDVPDVGTRIYYSTSLTGAYDTIESVSYNVPPQTETISGTTITYYTAPDGHKICLADQESNVAAIFTATGVAWYYIIDTTNQRFKLPRSKHEHYGNRPVIGNGMALGMTDGSHNMGIGQSNYSGIDYNRLYANTSHYGQNVSSSGSINTGGDYVGILGIVTDETKSGVISTPVQDTDQYKYLYFYVGEFTQTAIENTAGLNASLFNGKADTDLGNVSAGIDFVVESQLPTAGNNYTWYRKYKSGWVEQGGVYTGGSDYTTVTLPITMSDANYSICGISDNNSGIAGSYTMIDGGSQTTTGFMIIVNFSGPVPGTKKMRWQVSGMAAS